MNEVSDSNCFATKQWKQSVNLLLNSQSLLNRYSLRSIKLYAVCIIWPSSEIILLQLYGRHFLCFLLSWENLSLQPTLAIQYKMDERRNEILRNLFEFVTLSEDIFTKRKWNGSITFEWLLKKMTCKENWVRIHVNTKMWMQDSWTLNVHRKLLRKHKIHKIKLASIKLVEGFSMESPRFFYHYILCILNRPLYFAGKFQAHQKRIVFIESAVPRRII